MKLPRFMLAACSSGSGKTLLTCGILRLLQRKKQNMVTFKCGPDYIDPAFHENACGRRGYNLDPFFLNKEQLRRNMAFHGQGKDIAVVEGVMGYYDGISLADDRASSSEAAGWTETPVILIIDGSGMSRSVLAVIKGFLEYQTGSCIKGVFLNRTSPGMAKMLKKAVYEEFAIPVAGFLPKLKCVNLESRHLGLMMPEEIEDLQHQIDIVADELEKTLDYELLMKIAKAAPELPDVAAVDEEEIIRESETDEESRRIRIAVARDEAFCFIYDDNIRVLRELGAEPVFFSPIHDSRLPEDISGLILYGGYPELYGRELSENITMRCQIKEAVKNGLPVIGECGGFLYLHEKLTDLSGNTWRMAGALPYSAHYTGRLRRFGYVTLCGCRAFGKEIPPTPAHEFHYFESDDPGKDVRAVKPQGRAGWDCIHTGSTYFLGFPHLYYDGNRDLIRAFLEKCAENKNASVQEK